MQTGSTLGASTFLQVSVGKQFGRRAMNIKLLKEMCNYKMDKESDMLWNSVRRPPPRRSITILINFLYMRAYK